MANTDASTTPRETPTDEAPAAVSPSELEKLLERERKSAEDRIRTDLWKKIHEKDAELEALRTEKMSAKERAEHEQNKLRTELEEKAAKLNRKSLELLATQILKEKGLDIDFLDYVIGSDEDGTKSRIDKLKQTFDTALGKAVESQMKAHGRDPAKGRTGPAETSGFDGMTPKEIQAKAREDPEWYRKNQAGILKAVADGKIKKS